MGKEVFISYSRKDKEVVQPFVEEINKALGIKCWMDVDGIEGGTNFPKKLKEAIDSCKIVLFMLSDNSSESDWTQREVMYAQEKGKHVIPVVIDGKGLRGIFEFSLCDVQYIDIRFEEQKKKLVDNLRKRLTESKAKTQINPETFKEIMAEINEMEAEREAIGYYIAKFDNTKLKRIEKDGKWGFADESGNVVIPCRWNFAWHFSEGLAKVMDDNKRCGYIDNIGRVVIPCKWEWADNFSEDLARAMDDNGKYGFIDKKGRVVIPFNWKWAESFSKGMAEVKDHNGNWQKIDKTGKIVG